MHCIGFYFHVPAGVHGQSRAPEPSTPERAGLPPRRRRACDSPKSRTARRQPHPPQPSGLTPTSAFAAAGGTHGGGGKERERRRKQRQGGTDQPAPLAKRRDAPDGSTSRREQVEWGPPPQGGGTPGEGMGQLASELERAGADQYSSCATKPLRDDKNAGPKHGWSSVTPLCGECPRGRAGHKAADGCSFRRHGGNPYTACGLTTRNRYVKKQ